MRTIAAFICLAVLCALLAGCSPSTPYSKVLGEGKLTAKTDQSVTLGGVIYELPYQHYWADYYNLRIGGSYRLVEYRDSGGSILWRLGPQDVEAPVTTGSE